MSKRTEKRATSFCPTAETLERRAMLSAVPFSESMLISNSLPSNGYRGSPIISDLNQDGHNDLILEKRMPDSQILPAWRISNGDGTFGPEQEFHTPFFAQEYLDIDGDGDLDLYGRMEDNDVWFENTMAETENFREEPHVISAERNQAFGDLNNDGRIDFITWETNFEFSRQAVFGAPEPFTVVRSSTHDFTVHRNTGDGFAEEPIAKVTTDARGLTTKVMDIDSDGDLDLLLLTNDSATLLRNSHAVEGEDVGDESAATISFGETEHLDWNPEENPGSFGFIWASDWQIADLDEDGDLDLIQPEVFRRILWAENVGGKLQDTVVLTMPDDDLIINDVAFSADMDGDGVEQPVFRSSRRLVWFEDISVLESATRSANIQTVGHGDIDGDADIDFVEIVGNNIRWYDSILEGEMTPTVIQQTEIEQGTGLVAVDMDGDGDLDPALETRGSLVWYENLGSGEFGSVQHAATVTPTNWMAKDFDGDGLADVITWEAIENGRATFLHRNQGNGEFNGPVQVSSHWWLSLDDIDGDGDLDMVRRDRLNTSIELNENGSFVSAGDIPFTEFELEVADIDGDGDLDILGSDILSVAWYENAGNGEYTRHLVVQLGDLSNFANATRYDGYTLSDIDSDGDFDLLLENEHRFGDFSFSRYGKSKILKFDDGGFVEAGELRTKRFGEIEAVDLDQDGRQDYVSISSTGSEWYENLGDGQFEDARELSTEAYDFILADLDGDQKADLLTIEQGEKLRWQQNQLEEDLPAPASSEIIDRIYATIRSGAYNEEDDRNSDGVVNRDDVVHYLEQELGTVFGDVNLDGELNFGDFLAISSNFFVSEDARWTDGDINGDGEVGFGDFLLMFDLLRNQRLSP